MVGHSIAGKYLLLREIGRGGMGLIWEALDQQLERHVALKLMKPDHVASPKARDRFEREARAIAQLRNPHVIDIYDYGIDGGCPYFVMELLAGEDLETRLQRQPRLPYSVVTTIIHQAGQALTAAHSAGIVHRDLKPANLFLAQSDSGETVKALDFGLSAIRPQESYSGQYRQDAEGGELAGQLVGTPSYMSPEQMRSAPLDHRTDLWSLAIIAFRMLTGEPPFKGGTLGELMVAVCTDPPPRPSQLAPDLPPGIDEFFARALAKDPEQRFQSVSELVTSFAALGAGARFRPAKILVVDDEPDVALMLSQRFSQQVRKSIYQFLFASSGTAALEQLRLHPDTEIVLSDINMPDMDGLTLLRHIGKQNPLIKTVMVSAYSDMGNIRTAMNRGAYDFLVKPINFKDLELTIDKTLRHVAELRRNLRYNEENRLLRMFVSPVLADQLSQLGPSTLMLSEWRDGTVMFLDLGGSSIDSKAASASDAVRRLNANYEVVVPEIMARGGTIQHWVGTAIMAVFFGEAQVERALDTCLALRIRLRFMAERAGGQSPYDGGIVAGIDSGRVLLGSVGSQAFSRLDHSAAGEAVDTAYQLMRLASPHQILAGPSVCPLAPKRFYFEPLGLQAVPGRRAPFQVYDVQYMANDDAVLATAETLTIDCNEVSPESTLVASSLLRR